MMDLIATLNQDELNRLDKFLLDRIDDDAETEDKDEGVLDISELDGLLTAIVSGPVVVQPSRWLPVVWGDFEPTWESDKDFEDIFSLMTRHMNGIVTTLMEQPDDFEPITLEHEVKGKTHTIVDEWCEGYIRGVALTADRWELGGQDMELLLAPILGFTSATEWRAHDLSAGKFKIVQKAIAPNVREIHAYWLARREDDIAAAEPMRQSEPRVGRNDPCSCGSGKKYKKCCLH